MAISLDNSASAATIATSPVTWTHVVGTGTKRLLIVAFAVQGSTQGTATAVTYNGVTMVEAVAEQGSSALGKSETSIWFLFNPPQGSHTVSVTATVPTLPDMSGGSISFVGAVQTNTPDATGVATGTSAGAVSASITTVAQGAWIASIINYIDNGGSSPVITSSQTARQSHGMAINLNGSMLVVDTNGAVTPGSNTMNYSITSGSGATSELYTIAAASFSPYSYPSFKPNNIRAYPFSPGLAR